MMTIVEHLEASKNDCNKQHRTLADDWDAFAEFLEELALETLEGNPQSDAPVPPLQVRFLDILNNPQDPSQG